MNLFEGVAEALTILFWISIVSLPFAVWKWIEILCWLYDHVHISMGVSP